MTKEGGRYPDNVCGGSGTRTTDEFTGTLQEIAEADVVYGLKNRWSDKILHCGDLCYNCGERINRELHHCEENDER